MGRWRHHDGVDLVVEEEVEIGFAAAACDTLRSKKPLSVVAGNDRRPIRSRDGITGSPVSENSSL